MFEFRVTVLKTTFNKHSFARKFLTYPIFFSCISWRLPVSWQGSSGPSFQRSFAIGNVHLLGGRCTKLRAAVFKQATLIEIPDGFVFPGILSKSMSLSAGEWLGGEGTIHILNQNDLGKWAGQGTAQEKWGIRWKHINLSPSNLGCHDFQTPFKKAGPLLSTPFFMSNWKITIRKVNWKLQPNSYHHAQSQVFIGLLHHKLQC